MKLGAVLVILLIDPQFSIDLQLIGGVIILQTLPAVAIGLYTRWLHRWGLVAGWVAGMGLGTWMLSQIPNAAGTKKHFGGSAFPLSNWIDPTIFGINAKATMYVGLRPSGPSGHSMVAILLVPNSTTTGMPLELTRRP